MRKLTINLMRTLLSITMSKSVARNFLFKLLANVSSFPHHVAILLKKARKITGGNKYVCNFKNDTNHGLLLSPIEKTRGKIREEVKKRLKK